MNPANLADLEQIVLARTEQLRSANAQLSAELAKCQRSESALRENQKAVVQQERLAAAGQLAAGIAHDFNNILCVIQGYASLIQDNREAGRKIQDDLKQIAAAAERAALLTRQLQTFCGKQVIHLQSLELNEIIGNISRRLQRLMGEGISVQFHFSPKPVFIHADLVMIEQVVLNLAANARDAMPGGGNLVLAVSAEEFDTFCRSLNPEGRAGPFARLSVADTGCGIAPEHQGRIFEPFYTTRRGGKGAGLGLSTVYGIVKLHEGWIDVLSDVGKGSTFSVFLPKIGKSTSPQTQAAFRPAAQKSGEKILLVEDEAALRGLASAVLQKEGYEILEASSGAEALEVWRRQAGAFDLLLTDMVMPGGVTGRELAEKLMADRPRLKVIFTSGYSADMGAANFALREEVNFLAKPYPPKALIDIVRACLDRELPVCDPAKT